MASKKVIPTCSKAQRADASPCPAKPIYHLKVNISPHQSSNNRPRSKAIKVSPKRKTLPTNRAVILQLITIPSPK